MRHKIFLLFVFLFVFAIAPATFAQKPQPPDTATMRDPDLERDSLHNLEVARNYFKLKKAYVAALKRCEEIIAGNPNFEKIEEVLLMAGQSSLWLSQKRREKNCVCSRRQNSHNTKLEDQSSKNKTHMSLLVVGSVAYDEVETPFG